VNSEYCLRAYIVFEYYQTCKSKLANRHLEVQMIIGSIVHA
jgi:hypothetical protein